jgi:transportin-3
VDTPLITLIFDALSNDDTFEPAVECICSIIRETRETSESLNVINAIYPKVISLRPRIASHMHDPEVFRGYTKLFSEAGESWHVLIAQEPVKFRNLVESIAECTAYDEDLDVVQYTFYFWYSLKTMLTMKRFVEARNELADIYLKLIDVIIHHLRYPDGADNDLFSGDREEEDKFRSFRHEMGDVLKDCCAVVGSGKALHTAYEKIYTCLELQASGNSSVQWQDIEAPLFSMRAMAREVELTEHEILPNIMKLLVQLPEHPKIRYAATLVLGRYTEWTAKHPEYLDFQLQYITSGFAVEDRDVMSAAAQALMHFCQDCSELLVNYVEQLYPFYEKVAGELTLESLYEVTNGIAHVVASQSIQNIYVALQKFCKPIVDRLLLKAQQAGNEEVYRTIADEIELLTIFVSIVRPSHQEQRDSLGNGSQNIHPTSQFVVELYPVLVGTLLHAQGK